VCGRWSGKSFVPATIAVYVAAFKDWRPYLAPGEVGVIMIIAAYRRQARVIMRYCIRLLKAVPMLAKLVEADTRETIETAEPNRPVVRSMAGYRLPRLLNCLVSSQQCLWDGETEGLGGLEIHDHLELSRKLHREIAWLRAPRSTPPHGHAISVEARHLIKTTLRLPRHSSQVVPNANAPSKSVITARPGRATFDLSDLADQKTQRV
jgi:hypothetical protein